jgi:uncharacterized protein YjdB
MRRIANALARSSSALVGVTLAACLAACGGYDDVAGSHDPNRVVTTIRIEPATASLEVYDQIDLIASASGRTGIAIGGVTVTWTSSASAIASVDRFGEVTARAPGIATIFDAASGISGEATITVTAAATTR